MTRKDFELIANAIKATRANHERDAAAGFQYQADFMDGVNAATYTLADALATTNPNFDRARFLKACGVEGVY